jgi:hypothetical protein
MPKGGLAQLEVISGRISAIRKKEKADTEVAESAEFAGKSTPRPR